MDKARAVPECVITLQQAKFHALRKIHPFAGHVFALPESTFRTPDVQLLLRG